MWDEITDPIPNFNSAAVEVWEWISNFIPRFTGHMATYPCWYFSQTMLIKGAPVFTGLVYLFCALHSNSIWTNEAHIVCWCLASTRRQNNDSHSVFLTSLYAVPKLGHHVFLIMFYYELFEFWRQVKSISILNIKNRGQSAYFSVMCVHIGLTLNCLYLEPGRGLQ